MTDTDRQALDDLVLGYMQDRLDAPARAALEARMAADPALRSEIAALRAARAALGAEAPGAAEAAAGWARLNRAIDAEPTTDAPPDPSRSAPAKPANLNRPVRLWQALALAAACVALWQVAAVPWLAPAPDGGTFRPVGAPGSTAADAPALQVVLSGAADLDAVNALLHGLQARVVDGPGALGLYTLAFPDDAAREAALAALRARPDLVVSVTRP